jgi:hypothetical protein
MHATEAHRVGIDTNGITLWLYPPSKRRIFADGSRGGASGSLALVAVASDKRERYQTISPAESLAVSSSLSATSASRGLLSERDECEGASSSIKRPMRHGLHFGGRHIITGKVLSTCVQCAPFQFICFSAVFLPGERCHPSLQRLFLGRMASAQV